MDIMSRHSSEKALPYLPRVVFWGRIAIYMAKPGAAEDHRMIQMALKEIILVPIRLPVEAAACLLNHKQSVMRAEDGGSHTWREHTAAMTKRIHL